jgi:SAM-dependent methyltransferase
MESADLGEADLINAAFSLPFCDPAKAQSLWANIERALRPGGLFVGQFFGPRDAWAGTGLWTTSKDEIIEMLSSWEIHKVSEIEGMRRTSAGPEKWSHIFDVIARSRPT